MPIATKEIPQDFLDQMTSNLKKDDVEAENTNKVYNSYTDNQTVTSNSYKTEAPAAEGKKDKYADVMNVRLSKGRRNEIKTFCTSCGISVTQYIETSFEFLAKEVAAGRIVISKGGISKVEN